MITPAYVRTMAAYNAEMNRRLYAAADRLSDAERRADRGAFWKSIHGTLCHLVWGDQMWMSRLADWPKPTTALRDSAGMIGEWSQLRETRVTVDAAVLSWAFGIPEPWLAGDLEWFSGSAQRRIRAPRGFVIAHFFNHQAHHRGQAHTLLTGSGQATGDTDLILLVQPPAE